MSEGAAGKARQKAAAAKGKAAAAKRKAAAAKGKAAATRYRVASGKQLATAKAREAAAMTRESGPKAAARAVAKRLEIEPGMEEAVTRAYHRRRQRTPAYLPARSRGARPGDRPVVSVVVIVYQMSAQAARTLFTLSTAYQRDVSPYEYEVIVVENASDDNLNPRVVERMGPQFRYYRRTETGVSPTPAINVGLSLARGEYVALMVDGARMVSPGVLRNAMDAFRIQHDAVVAVPGYHVGYDDHMFREDAAHSLRQDRKLLAGIPWRSDGYRLFDISIQSDASPFGFLHPLGESNCMFAPREAYEAIGGADERFNLPGGGMVNLDMYCELLRPESNRLFHPRRGHLPPIPRWSHHPGRCGSSRADGQVQPELRPDPWHHVLCAPQGALLHRRGAQRCPADVGILR